MRFEKYLIEEIDKPEELVKLITTKCKPWLSLIKPIINTDKFFARQTVKPVNDFEILIPRKDRRPKDTPKEVSKLIDDAFYRKFQWKPRSEGVFATPVLQKEHRLMTRSYFFYPIGAFKYVWASNVDDLYMHVDIPYGPGAAKREAEKFLNNHLASYTNKNLLDVFTSKWVRTYYNEVMFKCSSYILINFKFKDLLIDNKLL